jgi:hypothetical protein
MTRTDRRPLRNRAPHNRLSALQDGSQDNPNRRYLIRKLGIENLETADPFGIVLARDESEAIAIGTKEYGLGCRTAEPEDRSDAANQIAFAEAERRMKARDEEIPRPITKLNARAWRYRYL